MHLGKCSTEQALGPACLVEVLRDPAEKEGPAGAEEEPRVDVGGLCDDPFLEQQVDLVRDGVQHVLHDLLPRARRVVDDDRLAAVRERGQCGREREPFGERIVHPFQHVVGDARADHLQKYGRSHRHPERHDCLVHLVDRCAVLDGVHDHARHPGQHAVDDEAGGIVDEDRPLPQLLADVPHRCERDIVRLGRPHHFEQRHQCNWVEEMHAGHAFRTAQVGCHVRDRERGGVRREDALVADNLFELCEDLAS